MDIKNYKATLTFETSLSELEIRKWFKNKLYIKVEQLKLEEIKENHNY
jgi:hypothetical protein